LLFIAGIVFQKSIFPADLYEFQPVNVPVV
jgi:hypothetical protein